MGDNIEAAVIIAGKDKVTEAVNKATRGLEGMRQKATDLSASFLLVTGGIEKAAGMIDNFISGAISYDQAVTRSKIAMEKFNVTTEQLTDSINQLADTTLNGLYSHQATAAAFQAIADEGRGLEGTLGIVEHAMHLTAVQGGDLAANTTMVEDIMSAMGLTIEDTARVVDVLNNTWKETGATSETVGSSIIQMGQTFQSLGWSIEQSSALIGVFKDVGQDSVTGLLSGLTQLANKNSAVSKTFQEMGISVFDSSGNLKAMPELFAAVQAAGFSAADMLAAFGIRGSSAMISALQNLDKVSAVTSSNLESLGNTAADAGEYGESAAADYERMKESVENMKTELAAGLLPVMQQLFQMVKPLLDVFSKYPAVIYAIVGAYIAWKIATIASTVATAARTVATWASTIAQWALNAAMYANPIVWIIALVIALIAIILLLVKNWDKVSAALGKFAAGAKEKLGAAKDAIGNFAGKVNDFMADVDKKAVEAVTNLWNKYKDFDGKVQKKLSELGNKAREGWENFKNGARDKIEDLGKWASDKFNAIMDFGSKAYEWGKNMMEKFKEGMEAMKEKIKEAAEGVGGWLKDKLGFESPAPKEGPLHKVPSWGEHMVQSFAEGVKLGIENVNISLDKLVTPAATGPVDNRRQAYNTYNNFNFPALNLDDPLLIRDLTKKIQEHEVAEGRR